MSYGSGTPGPDLGSWVTIIVFLSVALYNVLELNFLIISTFKKYRGLYFWSFVVSTWGVAFNAVGYLLRHIRPSNSGYLHATIILIGWCTMITGQSLVLYSRLHIVLHDPTRLRYVLGMIIANAVWLGIPVIVLVFGSNSNHPEPFRKPYSIFEKLQLTVFFVQELIISGLYIIETSRLLKMQRGVVNSTGRRVMGHLILLNVFVVLLDISILCLEFTEHYDIQTAWKALVYSVKLKAEFSVLNRLVEFAQHVRSGRHGNRLEEDNSADIALETYLRNASQTPAGAEYTMHVSSEQCDQRSQMQGIEVVQTTAVTVSRRGRPGDISDQRKGSNTSTQEEAQDDLQFIEYSSPLSSEARIRRP